MAEPSLQLRLTQKLALAPQLQQAIRLLQLNRIELREYIQEVLDTNPILERAETQTGAEDGDFDPAEKPADEARIEAAILSLMPEITARDIPFMGCCYGISILAHHLGAEVSKRRWAEPVGPVTVRRTEEGRRDPLLRDLPDSFPALVGHKEATQALPAGCVHLLASETCPYQMIRHRRNVYATQFHPEADGQVFIDRIEVYKHRGYFPPDEADRIAAICGAADTHWPPLILRAFVSRYG